MAALFYVSFSMSNPLPDVTPSPTLSHRWRNRFWWGLLLLLALLTGGLLWKTRIPQTITAETTLDLSPEALDSRLLQAEAALASLQRTQATLSQRLTDTRARTNLLRDEVLGVTQRSALLEDSLRELSNSRHPGEMALRLDETELLLTLAQERLLLAHDLAGALRATELADGTLSSLNDPTLINLRQTLAQELSALRSLPKAPQAIADEELNQLEAQLPQLSVGVLTQPTKPNKPLTQNSGFQRLLNALIQVRPSGEQDLLSPADRNAGEAALSLEIALARTALDRHDQAAFQQSIKRMDQWLQRLYADSPLLRERRARLKKIAVLTLNYRPPLAGSTLEELRSLQHYRQRTP